MTADPRDKSIPADAPAIPAGRFTPAEAALMAEYGIAHETLDRFRVGDYCYGSLKDALAEAKRRRPAPAGG